MAGMSSRRGSRPDYTWPGYVDALSSLLMVFIFVLAMFVVAQFYLSDALGTRDQALDRLNRQMAELANLLSLEQRSGADLRATIAALSTELQKSTAERDRLQGQVSVLGSERDQLLGQITQLGAEKGKTLAELTEQQRLSADLERLHSRHRSAAEPQPRDHEPGPAERNACDGVEGHPVGSTGC